MDPFVPATALVLVTADPRLREQVLVVTAAIGVEIEVLGSAADLRGPWRQAAMVLVGVDEAAAVSGLGLPRRGEVFVVGREADRDETHAWSVPLGAAVLSLPGDLGQLAEAIADVGERRTRTGRLVAVVGGSGGVGVSTYAVALALAAARSGSRTLLVDADPEGGGLDLLLGAERAEGWRWPRLSHAQGHLGDLGGQLPQVDGVDVLSMDRSPEVGTALRPEPLRAVLGSALRGYGHTVVDLPRGGRTSTEEVVHRADLVLLLVHAGVRGVAAARPSAHRLLGAGASVGLVVRLGRARGLDSATVATALDLPLVSTVADEPGLAVAAERGDLPGRGTRSGLGRSCLDVLRHLAADPVPA